MSTSMLQSLLEMGFSQLKAEKAVQECGENIDSAMEWLLTHQDDPNLSQEQTEGSSTTIDKSQDGSEKKEANSVEDNEQGSSSESAKSLKCDECNKLFNNSDEVEYHAIKSGHSSFSESTEEKKALTEEEKKEKLKQLEDRLKERRQEKSLEERKDALHKEKKRIQNGKDMAEAKRKHEETEMKKIADERRREKLEDKKARERVKEQIEKDRLARKERGNMAGTGSTTFSALPTPAKQTNTSNATKKVHETTRLQIRLPSSPPLIQTFKAKEELAAVYLYVNMNRPGGCEGPKFTLSTTFPRRIFTDNDMETPLHVLDLVPSAVLVLVESKE